MAEHRRTWRGDLLTALLVLALVGIAFALRGGHAAGQTARITTPDGVRTLPLSQDATLTLVGRDGYSVTLEVQDGAARFVAADCPDLVCVNTGWISRPGATAACLPAGIVLCIDGESEVDAVAN